MSSSALQTLFHLVGAASFGFGCYYDWVHVIIPPQVHRMGVNFAGKLKFLTYWDALIQTFFFALCLVIDLTNSVTLRKFRDKLQSTIAFPLSMFVGITFWGIYFVDRELVFPRALDPFFPVWLNHLMHTNIMVFQMIEMSTTYAVYPPRGSGLKTLIGFLLVYLIWMHVIYFMSGFWVYPIFEVLNTPLRILFFIVLFFVVSSMYILGEKVNAMVWSNEIRGKKKKQKN